MHISFLAGSEMIKIMLVKPKTASRNDSIMVIQCRSSINTKRVETPVGLHFNLPNHSILDMSVQGIASLGHQKDAVWISRERLD